jgi:hypothetical protein
MLKLLWPILLLAVAITSWREDIQANKENDAFASHAERAVAIPPTSYTEVTHYKKKGALGDKKVTAVTYEADINFRTKSGAMVTVPNKNVPGDALKKMAEGEPVALEYLPEDTSKVRFLDAPHLSRDVNTKTYLALILVGALWLVGAVLSLKK